MAESKSNRKEVRISLSPASYAALEAAARAAGYDSIAAYVYEATSERVLAETGKRLAALRRGAPRKDKGDRE